MADFLGDNGTTLASLVVLAGLVLGVIGYARRPRAVPERRELAPTLIPADSTDFAPSTIAAPATRQRRDTRGFDDSE